MSLPRFFSRVADAVGPVANLGPDALASLLANRIVTIRAPLRAVDEPDVLRATLLAVNLASRIYPQVRLDGPGEWADQAGALATAINPSIDLLDGHARASDTAVLQWREARASRSPNRITVEATGWNVALDGYSLPKGDAHPVAELAAAALGMGEVFRAAFALALGEAGRVMHQPGAFNLITGGEPTDHLPAARGQEVGAAHLVGAGAIGQACLLALIAAGVRGPVTVVDHEAISLSNLQRYVLTTDKDVGEGKTTLAVRAALGSGLEVMSVPTRWGADNRSGPGAEVVLVALDSAADRIAVAASLPLRAYNAWTQPADTGWSRHEAFGSEPCLACLYYPQRSRPHEYQLIAASLGQHPLRVLSYLVTGQPIGAPLPGIASVPTLPRPADAARWLEESLASDLVASGLIPATEVSEWAHRPVGLVYRDGVCAGGLVRTSDSSDAEQALVPLAHQSAFAGIMLATQLLASSDGALRGMRGRATEARLDQMRGLPQVLHRPRVRTPGCFCSDPVFLGASNDGSLPGV